MFKRITFLSLISLLTVSASAFAMAPDRVQHVEIGVLGGGAFNDKADDTGYVQANIDYGVTPWIALGVEGGWQEANLSATEDQGAADLLFDFILRVPNHPFHEQLVPYGVLGLGAVWGYVDNSGADDSEDSSFGWKLGGGVDWFINDNWAVNFEVAYIGSSIDLPRTTAGNDASDFWTVGAGLKYIF
jgi:opacity protein-like surface antigen